MEPIGIEMRAPDGIRLAGLLWRGRRGAPGVVIVHGAGSRKENHADVAAACAGAGMWALALDLRGHGASAGAPGPGMLDDVLAALGRLEGEGAGPLGLRGSSLGGFLALHAAARRPGVGAVVALCPPGAERVARVLDGAWPDPPALEEAVARADGVARGYWHARGDEVVPWAGTMALAGRTPQPRRLRVVMGGHHRSLQHDPAVIAETTAFLAGHLGGGAVPSGRG